MQLPWIDESRPTVQRVVHRRWDRLGLSSNVRLAYLSQARIPSRDASAVQIVSMCEAFVRRGAEVRLHARGAERGLSFDDWRGFFGVDGFDVVVHPCPAIPKLGGLIHARAVARSLERDRPDVLYGRHVLSLFAARHLGVPAVYEVHEPPVRAGKAQVERWLFRAPTFRGLVAISHALADWYRAHVPELEGRPVIVEPDATRIHPMPGQEQLVRSPSPRRIQVGYVGHLYPGKGMEVMVPLASRLPSCDFHVVGGDASDLGDQAPAELPGNLRFHGFVPHSEVPDRLRNFDILLAPYQRSVAGRRGGDLALWMSPLKIFECLGAARALVASDLPVLREVLDDGETALLCEPTDLDAWEAAVRRLAEDRSLRAALGRRGREVASERYTWEARADRLLGHLSGMMLGRDPG